MKINNNNYGPGIFEAYNWLQNKNLSLERNVWNGRFFFNFILSLKIRKFREKIKVMKNLKIWKFINLNRVREINRVWNAEANSILEKLMEQIIIWGR